MGKVTVKGLRSVDKKLKKFNKEIEKLFSGSDSIQEHMLKDLKEEIKSGKSPATGKSFRKLKDSTVKSRRKRSKYNSTDPSFSPGTSALTFSGQLVDSLKAKIKIGAKSIRVTIEPTGKRSPYKNKDGSNTKGSAKKGNKKLAEYHAEGSPKRDLLGFTKKKEKEIVKLLRDGISGILSKKLRR
tara:strand:+ start:831 stop:1382 length:552 start_codon:yes stop_codon:yes gene_type:complete